jgi:hypothetical protein
VPQTHPLLTLHDRQAWATPESPSGELSLGAGMWSPDKGVAVCFKSTRAFGAGKTKGGI